MSHIEFDSYKEDPEILMHQAISSDESKKCRFALLYVDDVLMVSEIKKNVTRWVNILN